MPIQTCCSHQCFEAITISDQENFFNYFWKSAGDYKSQNIVLSGLMEKKNVDEVGEAQKINVTWPYSFHSSSNQYPVCKKFLCNLLNIGRERFATVQKKIKNNENIGDDRGKHDNHLLLLSPELKKIIHDQCLSIPHSESHYSREKTELLSFDHPDLTFPLLYKLFLDYY